MKRKLFTQFLRRNEEGLIYDVSYVDHRTESVFNGSDLGKQYSAKSIVEKCRKEGKETLPQKHEFVQQSGSKIVWPEEQNPSTSNGTK